MFIFIWTLFHIEMISVYFSKSRDRMIDSNGYFFIPIVVCFIHESEVMDFKVYLLDFWKLCNPSHIPRMRDILGLRGVI